MTLWQHWMVGQIDASIAAAALLLVAMLARRAWSPRVRSVILSIALVRLALPPLVHAPWSEALVDLPPIDDTRLMVAEWLSADMAMTSFAITTVVTFVLLVRLVHESRTLAALAGDLASPPLALQAQVDRLAGDLSIQLRIAPNGEGPMAMGLFYKTIVLPASLVDRLEADAMAAVLAHEVAHHTRGDLYWLTGAALLKAVVWFNPLAHVLARALVATREEGSDDWAIARTSQDPFAYAHALLQSARLVVAPKSPLVARAHPMGGRLQRLLKGHAPRDGRPGVTDISAIVLAATLCLPSAHMPTLNAFAGHDDPVIVIKRVLSERGIQEIRNR
jgi:bla regulator protein blaR1